MNGSLNKALKDINGFAVFVSAFMLMMSILTVFSQSMGMLGFVVMFGGIMPVTYIEQDRQRGWEVYERMLPVNSRQVISSKYILLIVTEAMFFVCALLGHIIGGVICKNAGGRLELPMPEDITIIDADYLKLLSFVILLSLAVSGLLIVILYRFRNNHFIRFSSSFICIITGVCSTLLVSNDDDFTGPLSEISAAVLAGALIIAAAVCIASYLLSVKMYEKFKD